MGACGFRSWALTREVGPASRQEDELGHRRPRGVRGVHGRLLFVLLAVQQAVLCRRGHRSLSSRADARIAPGDGSSLYAEQLQSSRARLYGRMGF